MIVRLPREPKPHQAALLRTLGARWVVDPARPKYCPHGCHQANTKAKRQ